MTRGNWGGYEDWKKKDSMTTEKLAKFIKEGQKFPVIEAVYLGCKIKKSDEKAIMELLR